jgi:hypothetical protein
MNIELYIKSPDKTYKKSCATKRAYRPYPQTPIESFENGVKAANKSARTRRGASDFIVSKGALTIGRIEAKDIGENLNAPKRKKRFFALATFGARLRDIHSLQSRGINERAISFAINGSNIVEKSVFSDEKIYINADRYIAHYANIIAALTKRAEIMKEIDKAVAF